MKTPSDFEKLTAPILTHWQDLRTEIESVQAAKLEAERERDAVIASGRHDDEAALQRHSQAVSRLEILPARLASLNEARAKLAAELAVLCQAEAIRIGRKIGQDHDGEVAQVRKLISDTLHPNYATDREMLVQPLVARSRAVWTAEDRRHRLNVALSLLGSAPFQCPAAVSKLADEVFADSAK